MSTTEKVKSALKNNNKQQLAEKLVALTYDIGRLNNRVQKFEQLVKEKDKDIFNLQKEKNKQEAQYMRKYNIIREEENNKYYNLQKKKAISNYLLMCFMVISLILAGILILQS